MWLHLVQLLGGLALIIKGGDAFVSAAVRLAVFLRMPRVVIGTTLVSLATTSPEMVVSLMAGARGESGLAVGNAVGSCICNVALILGLTAWIRKVVVHPRVLLRPLIAMFGFGFVVFLFSFDLSVERWQGALLLAAGAGYFASDFWTHWRARQPAENTGASALEADIATTRWPWFQTRAGTLVQFLIGAAVVVWGSRFLVDGAVGLAALFGIPSIVIGLTVVAVGTSLPELVTAITSSRRAVSDLSVGNILGANIANLSLVVGAAAVLTPVSMTRVTQLFNFPAMLVVFGLMLWMFVNGGRVSRREGSVLLAAYGVYLGMLVALTLGRHG